MSSENLNDIAEICANALTAFSLVLSSRAKLSVLKQDEFSLVVKVSCASDFYVLKRVNAKSYFATEETAEVQNSLMQFAGPERSRTADGTYLFHEKLPDHNNAVWTLSRFIPNAPSFDWLDISPSWTCAHSYSAGEILAQLHNKSHEVSAKLNAATSSDLISAISQIPDWLENAFAEPLSKDIHGQTEDVMSIVDRSLVLEKIRQCTVSLEGMRPYKVGQYEIIPRKEPLMIHGDFQPGNVLFVQDQVVGVIDWDYAHLDDPLLELAYGMIMFSAKFAVPGETFDRALANAFLHGYYSACKRSAWLVYRGHAELLPGASHSQSELECNLDELHSLLLPYVKLAASLILLWLLSEQGRKHEHRFVIESKAVYLILSECNLFAPETSSSDVSISQLAPHDNGAS